MKGQRETSLERKQRPDLQGHRDHIKEFGCYSISKDEPAIDPPPFPNITQNVPQLISTIYKQNVNLIETIYFKASTHLLD